MTWNSHSRTRILFDAPTSPTSRPNQHLEEKSTFVRLLFQRIGPTSSAKRVALGKSGKNERTQTHNHTRTTNQNNTHQTNKQNTQSNHQKSSKPTIKQTNKEGKQKQPKTKPYIKKLATPDRPPPAAVMLIE